MNNKLLLTTLLIALTISRSANNDVIADTQAEAEQYFAETYALQPNIKLTIKKPIRYKHTKKAATALPMAIYHSNIISTKTPIQP